MKASTFIHSRTGHPKIAFLYKTRLDQEEARVAVYRLTKDDKGGDVSKFDPHKDRELDLVIPDPYASMIIPVPVEEEKRYHVRNNEGAKAHLGGLLVVGETVLIYYDSLTYTSYSAALTEAKVYVAWAEVDGTHYFLADDYGRLDLLTIETTVESTGTVVTGLTVTPMKFQDSTSLTSRASTLVCMSGDVLFIASHHGDSQIVKFDINTNTLALIKSISNNAPILDFSIMDMGNREGDSQLGNAYSSGQARIVAGCGAYKDGSLRSIRSGVGLEERGILEDITDTRGLFALQSHKSRSVDTLAISSIAETRILRFDPEGGIEEVYDFQGLVLDSQTLLASSLKNGHLLQITPRSVVLLDSESGVAVSRWDAPEVKLITAAAANHKWAMVAVDGLTLVSLNLLENLTAQVYRGSGEVGPEGQTDQISCLHIARDHEDIGVVGWWSSGSISIVDMASLKALHGESLRQTEGSASVPRDIALVQLHPPEVSGPTLLVAMEDGNVITFNASTPDFSLSGRKSVTLGSNPARLNILPQEDGTATIFATTEHASLIYSSEGRTMYSATTADDATFVVRFDWEALPDSIAVATDSQIRICHVDRERLTHVKTLPMKETVRRVAYSPTHRAFGLGCIKKELRDNEEVITSSFKLVDEIIFQELGEPFILDAAGELELVECVIRAALPDSNGDLVERFVVGTSIMYDDATASDVGGRILVLGVDDDRKVYQLESYNLRGACRCLGTMDSHIVAGLSKTVAVYSYSQATSVKGQLQRLATYRPAAFPIDLDISGNMIGVVDLMQSLSIVEFVPPRDGASAKLEEKARHFQPGSATSVCHLEGESWLEADAQGNILVLRRNLEAPTEHDRSKLEITSEMNMGEQINRIRRLHAATDESTIVSPQAFLGSVSFKAQCFFWHPLGMLLCYGPG
jgi:DNA damage-binding protein 1